MSVYVCDNMLWYSPNPRCKNSDSGAKTVCIHGVNTFPLLYTAIIKVSNRHLGHWQKAVSPGALLTATSPAKSWGKNMERSWKPKHSDSSVEFLGVSTKGQSCDPSDFKAQELRKGRDVIGFFFWASLMPKTLSPLLWKITWLLKSPLHCQARSREKHLQCWWQLSCRGILVLSQCDPTEQQHRQ